MVCNLTKMNKWPLGLIYFRKVIEPWLLYHKRLCHKMCSCASKPDVAWPEETPEHVKWVVVVSLTLIGYIILFPSTMARRRSNMNIGMSILMLRLLNWFWCWDLAFCLCNIYAFDITSGLKCHLETWRI